MKKIALALLAAAVSYGGGLTGKWSGDFAELGPDGAVAKNSSAYMVLTVAGSTVTGTAGPDEEHQSEISSGRIEGTKVTFDLKRGPGTLKFNLIFDGSTLKGTAMTERDGEKLTAKLDLKRKE